MKHELAAINLEYRVGVGNFSRVSCDFRCGAPGEKVVTDAKQIADLEVV